MVQVALLSADVAALLCGIGILELLTGQGVAALVLAPALLALIVAGKLAGSYDRDLDKLTPRTLDEVPVVTGVLTAVVLGLAALTPGMESSSLLVLLGSACLLTPLFRAVARDVAARVLPPERCLVIGDEACSQLLERRLSVEPRFRAEVVAHIDVPGSIRAPDRGYFVNDLMAIRALVAESAIDRVVVASGAVVDARGTLDLIRFVKALGVRVSVLPKLFEVLGASVRFDDVHGMTLLGIPGFGLSRSSRLVKRAVDVVGAAIGLIAVAPLLALIAIALRLDSRGPVFFRQPRVGRDGCTFGLFKFRTMIVGAEAQKPHLRELNQTRGLFKLTDDPRVTRVGRWLRRTSLDELPQLLNVLLREMSLVGPRPLVIDEDEQVRGWDRRRLHLKPGMTGPWQILSGVRLPLEEMVKLDYLYAANWSLWGDVKILLRTVAHVTRARGL